MFELLVLAFYCDDTIMPLLIAGSRYIQHLNNKIAFNITHVYMYLCTLKKKLNKIRYEYLVAKL